MHQKLYKVSLSSINQPVSTEEFYYSTPFHVDIDHVKNNLTSVINQENYSLISIEPLNVTISDCLDIQRYQVANLYRAFHHLDYCKFCEALELELEEPECSWKWQRFQECALAMKNFTLEEIESIVSASWQSSN